MGEFTPLKLEDKKVFDTFLAQDPPETSELTFTNLFMWRYRYHPMWQVWNDCLLIVFCSNHRPLFALPPVGPGPKLEALVFLSEFLMDFSPEAHICRVSKAFVERYVKNDLFSIREDRANSDYVYLTEDLINLPGNRFHKKKNLLNQFKKKYRFEYKDLSPELLESFLELQENWCELKNCAEDQDLTDEDHAIYEALRHQQFLGFRGGAIFIDSKVVAFSLGELLNPRTAVIHIEKADPSIVGAYASINNLFCQEAWADIKFINREQDLGLEGLRKAKQSYNPDHLVDKFTLIPLRD